LAEEKAVMLYFAVWEEKDTKTVALGYRTGHSVTFSARRIVC
jgi:hypothetical protein